MTIKISQLANLTVVQANTVVPVVSNITGTLTTVQANVQQLRDYIVATGVSANITALFTNAATQSDLIIGINSNVTQANLGMKGYVDSISGSESIANVNMKGYVDGQITAANTGVTTSNIGIKGYVDQANSIQSAQINAANIGIIGYIDLGNTSMKSYVNGQITAANAGVTSANIGMKGYVDNQTYSNVQTLAFLVTSLPTYEGNIGVNVNITNGTVTANSFVGDGSQLTNLPGGGGSYSNVNVAAFTNLSNYAYNANVTAANLGMKGYVDSVLGGGSSYGNSNVASYLISTQVSVANILLAPSGNIVFADGTVQTTAGGGNYSNVQVATYLPTYSGVVTASNVAVNGNVTAQYLFGNGSQLTGIVASGGNYGNIDVKAFLETDAGPGDGFQRVIEGYYANLILGDTTKLFSFGNSSKSYFGHDGFANININYVRADNSDVRIATNNGAYIWTFDNAGNLTLSGNTFSVNYANGTPVTFSSSSYGNINVQAYTETMGFQNFGNVNVAAYVTTANSAVIGYVDNAVSTANVGIIGYIDRGNTIVTAGITTANVGMKGYVDNLGLDNLSDVVISSPTVGDVLYYNGTNWVKQNGPTIRWSLSASGTSDYVFTGPGFYASTNDPLLYLHRGTTYIFVNTVHGSHPLEIRVSNGGAAYANGVSGAGTATITFTVPMDAPSTLYYQCTVHSIMGNTINVVT